MVDYIGPVFEELKADSHDLKNSIDSKTQRLETMLHDKTHRLEVLMESLEQKILGALETYFVVSAKEETIKNHDERLKLLERDVKILKSEFKV